MEYTDMHISETYITYHILHSWRARPCCMKILHGSHLLDQGPGLQHLILWGLNAVLIALLPPCIANTVRIQNNFFKGTTVQMCMKHKEGHVRWRANVTTSSMTPPPHHPPTPLRTPSGRTHTHTPLVVSRCDQRPREGEVDNNVTLRETGGQDGEM